MSCKALVVIGAVLGLLALAMLSGAAVVQAQDAAPGADANCLACHVDLYFLYDTGNWHCLCEASPSCVHCHGGQPESMKADLAHAGMIVNPLQENAVVCQKCHPDEYQRRVDEFIAVAGGAVTGGRGRTFPTPGPEPTGLSTGVQTYRLPEQLREPWRLVGLTVISAALLAVSAYSICCYRIDRQRATKPSSDSGQRLV